MKTDEIVFKVPAIMGILNVTADSFYDGGRYMNRDCALERARQMVREGADIIDVGGESTRPGSSGVPLDEELRRVIPVISSISEELDIKISCDTSKPEVASQALQAGAHIINDVTGFSNPEMRSVAASHGAVVCVMHMQGTPRTMQESPSYIDVVSEIKDYLYMRAGLCEESGIDRSSIIIDPGIGFGKTLEHNLRILSNIGSFSGKYPVMIGASRKSFLENLFGDPPRQRLAGSLAAAGYTALNGVSILRVHDVIQTYQTVRLVKLLKEKTDE